MGVFLLVSLCSEVAPLILVWKLSLQFLLQKMAVLIHHASKVTNFGVSDTKRSACCAVCCTLCSAESKMNAVCFRFGGSLPI